MNRERLFKILGPIGAILLAIATPLLLSNIYWTSVLTMIVINSLMAASLRTIFTIGEFSLGHVGFMCLGAYASALLTLKAGLPFGLTLPIAGLISGLVAVVLGHPFMRVKGIYFSILTLVTSESIRLLAFNWKNMTGGTDGLIGFPGAGVLSVPGLGQVDFEGFTEYYFLTLGVVCASLFILYRLERS
jgi:branched-chain amino acid transport system permease protein